MYEKLLQQAKEKAAAARTLLEGESPDMEQIKALQAEADSLMEKANAYKATMVTIDAADNAIGTYNEIKSQPPEKQGLAQVKVVKDETDKQVESEPPFKSMGDFFMAVSGQGEYGNPEANKILQAVRSKDTHDEGGYNLGKAIGYTRQASLSDMRKAHWAGKLKAISGMSELVPADGGFLVQTDTDLNILSRMYNVGQLIQRVGMIGISANSNSLTLYGEDETSRATGSRRGGIRAYWASEGDEKTSSKPKFREINFKLQKLIGLVYATDELMADASALESWIMQNLPEELVFTAENAIIRGTGAGQPQGVIGAGCTVSVAKETGQNAATIVSENIINMWARRWARATDYVWLVNQDCGPELHALNLPVGTGGALVYMPPGGLSQSPYGTLYGRPVIESEYCSTLGTVGDIILFSPSQYQMIDKGGIQSATSIHVRFIYDEQVFRFVYRIDGKPLWHQPLTPFQGTNTQSPFVTLATRA